jgi:hypothetical protein
MSTSGEKKRETTKLNQQCYTIFTLLASMPQTFAHPTGIIDFL